MARRGVTWSPRAKDEFKETLDFYKARNGNANYSRRIREAVKRRIELLQEFPEIGHPGTNESTRILSAMNFGIIYEYAFDEITILSFWDFRRDPKDRPDFR